MILYRIEYRYDWDENVSLELLKFDVGRKTPKGYYILVNYEEKWIPANAKKAYAYPTIEQARTNFIKRNQTRKKILTSQLKMVEQSLKKIETFYKPKQKP
jgi:hypothetical protein